MIVSVDLSNFIIAIILRETITTGYKNFIICINCSYKYIEKNYKIKDCEC